jgi:hypothetical protein
MVVIKRPSVASCTSISVRAEPVEASALHCAPFDRLRANGDWLMCVTNQGKR